MICIRVFAVRFIILRILFAIAYTLIHWLDVSDRVIKSQDLFNFQNNTIHTIFKFNVFLSIIHCFAFLNIKCICHSIAVLLNTASADPLKDDQQDRTHDFP